MPTIQPTKSPYADAAAAEASAPRSDGLETMNAVRNAASAEPNINADQPSRKAPAPPLTDLATMPRIPAVNAISKMARRSWANRLRMAPLELSAGPMAQRGQVRTWRNQSHAELDVACLSTHSETAWLPKMRTSAAVAMTPA